MTDPLAISTADPRFDPKQPITVNGYRFVPVDAAMLADLDPMIRLFLMMASLGTDDFYDNLWNLRNRLTPFKPGDEHFDVEG